MAQLAAAAAAAGAAALGVAACYCSGGGGGEPQGSAAAPEGAAAAPVAASSSSVVAVEGDEEFEALVAANKSVLVDFSAAWCRPCKAIAPLFAESAPTLPTPRHPPGPTAADPARRRRLAAEHAGTVFAKVDVDVCEETAQKCGVNSMPTFQHFDRGSKVAELVGRPLPPTPLEPTSGAQQRVALRAERRRRGATARVRTEPRLRRVSAGASARARWPCPGAGRNSRGPTSPTVCPDLPGILAVSLSPARRCSTRGQD